MIITAFRIVQAKYVKTAFSGEGARLHGGRWNSPGTRVVYVASSVSLATLELLVHLDEISVIHNRYAIIPVSFDAGLVEALKPGSLAGRWNTPAAGPKTQRIGDRWAAAMSSPALEVPSVVTAGEMNYLLNPAHPDFPKLKIGKAYRFKPDARLR